MSKCNSMLFLFVSALFLSSPVYAEPINCPDGGAAMPVKYGDVVNCALESSGDLDIFSINAKEGDFISANVSIGEEECTGRDYLVLRLFGENNEVLSEGTAGFCAGTRVEFVAPTDRKYILAVSNYYKKPQAYQVEFQCISGSCISQKTADCTSDGNVDITDIVCVINSVLSNN